MRAARSGIPRLVGSRGVVGQGGVAALTRAWEVGRKVWKSQVGRTGAVMRRRRGLLGSVSDRRAAINVTA